MLLETFCLGVCTRKVSRAVVLFGPIPDAIVVLATENMLLMHDKVLASH